MYNGYLFLPLIQLCQRLRQGDIQGMGALAAAEDEKMKSHLRAMLASPLQQRVD